MGTDLSQWTDDERLAVVKKGKSRGRDEITGEARK